VLLRTARVIATGKEIRVFSWIDETGTVVDSYWAQGTYGKVLTGSLWTGWNAIITSDPGNGQHDLGPELKALVQSVRNSDDRGGPTS
jgi:hypothetical protein